MTKKQFYLEILQKIQIDRLNDPLTDLRIKKVCKKNIKKLQKAIDKEKEM